MRRARGFDTYVGNGTSYDNVYAMTTFNSSTSPAMYMTANTISSN